MACLIPLLHKRNVSTWLLWKCGTFSFSTVWLGLPSIWGHNYSDLDEKNTSRMLRMI